MCYFWHFDQTSLTMGHDCFPKAAARLVTCWWARAFLDVWRTPRPSAKTRLFRNCSGWHEPRGRHRSMASSCKALMRLRCSGSGPQTRTTLMMKRSSGTASSTVLSGCDTRRGTQTDLRNIASSGLVHEHAVPANVLIEHLWMRELTRRCPSTPRHLLLWCNRDRLARSKRTWRSSSPACPWAGALMAPASRSRDMEVERAQLEHAQYVLEAVDLVRPSVALGPNLLRSRQARVSVRSEVVYDEDRLVRIWACT